MALMQKGTKGPSPITLSYRKQSKQVPLIRTIPTNGISPSAIFQKGNWHENTFLIDGTMGGWFDGDFSLLGASPFGIFQSKGKHARFDYLQSKKNQTFFSSENPVTVLESWLRRFKMTKNPESLFPDIPFLYGGVAGFFSYDLVRQFEKIPSHREEEHDIPDIGLLFLNFFIVVDHRQDIMHLIYNPLPEIEMGADGKTVYRTASKKLDEIEVLLMDTGSSEDDRIHDFTIEATKDCTARRYIEMVHQAKQYIAAGDIFQVNLSHHFTAPYFYKSLFGIYQKLSQINPSPFASYFDLQGIQIASGSPERLVRVINDIVETCPIAGTKPRGKDVIEDERLIQSLYSSKKEQAEHLMLIDLERNDLGKICRYGTVFVDSMMALEKYSHVSHLVSNIKGKLIAGTSPLHVLNALFPGGTITGVPKIRCMEIIAELEKRSRGIYTGAIGYIGFDGEIDLNIAIRTCVRKKNVISFQVGAGIVADSNPELEYEETLHKAAAFMKAIRAS